MASASQTPGVDDAIDDSSLNCECDMCISDLEYNESVAFCQDCEENLCASCLKFHSRTKLTKHHKVLPKPYQSSKECSSPKSDGPKVCDVHGELIKFYCSTHDALMCVDCAVLTHRSRTCVLDNIRKISSTVINSLEYNDTITTIENFTEECKNVKKNIQILRGLSSDCLEQALFEIKSHRQEIERNLDILEKKAEDEARQCHKKNNKILASKEKTCDEIINSLQVSGDTLQHLNTKRQAPRLFTELKSCKKFIRERGEKLMVSEQKFFFQKNSKIQEFLQNQESLGSVQIVRKPAVSFPFSNQKILVKSCEDRNRCWVTGLTLIGPNKLICTDRDNFSVKMVDVFGESVIEQLKLVTRPWDVTKVTSTEIAVTVPFERKILFISLSSNKLKLNRAIKVNGMCYGISCYEKKLIVSFQDPVKLEICQLDGTTIKLLKSNSSGESMFMYPNYVASSRNGIYVSDWGKHAVMRLNWSGDVLACFGDIASPQGMALLEDERLLVGDNHEDKCNIQLINVDCTRGEVVLGGSKKTFALCFREGELYISYVTCDDTEDNSVRCFRMCMG